MRIEVRRRLPRSCPSCGAPHRIYTHPQAGTRITASCDPYRCHIARTIALAAGPMRPGAELLPMDDRNVRRIA